MRSSRRRVKSSTRCAMNPCKDSASWRKGGGAARQWSDGEWHGDLRSALWLHSSWTRSRPLRSAHSCTVRLPLSPSLNICCVCAACDRRRWLLLLWSQDRRTSTARRCGSLLYIGLDHAERLESSGAAADRRAASIPLGSWCTAVADGATTYLASCSIGLSGGRVAAPDGLKTENI